MQTFEEYLKQHNLEALMVSIRARVRYVTIYNAVKGNPISSQHAQQIKQAVLTLTGVPFTGNFVLIQQASVDELPTLPMKSIPKHHVR